MLADNLDVASNVFLGNEAVRWKIGPLKILNKALMEHGTRELIDRLKVGIFLQYALRVRKSIRRAAPDSGDWKSDRLRPRVIIMDEPTAALSVAAIDKVIDLINQLKAQGASIIIISHRLEDIFRCGDRVMVLRHGRKVGDLTIRGEMHDYREEIVAYMVGASEDSRTEGQGVQN